MKLFKYIRRLIINASDSKYKSNVEKSEISNTSDSHQIIEQIKTIKALGIKQYEYIGSNDSCPTCLLLDGKVFNIAELEIGVNAPPLHERCRCSIASYISRDSLDNSLKERGL